jgi:predicted esterase
MQHLLTTQYTARYYTLGEANEDPQQEVWLVLHGYGQLARYFVRKFEFQVQKGAWVVAPEGLSLFYLQGTDGRVGANWMTREFREYAIDNHLAYLQKLYQELNLQNKRLVLFSFSQGGATLLRWVVKHQPVFYKMIMWAGGFPADVDVEASRRAFQNKELLYVYGDQDEYITSERIAKQEPLFQQFGFRPQMVRFAGGHTVDPLVLQKL